MAMFGAMSQNGRRGKREVTAQEEVMEIAKRSLEEVVQLAAEKEIEKREMESAEGSLDGLFRKVREAVGQFEE